VATRDVAERVRQVRFADADGPDDDHVCRPLEEAQRDELVPQRMIVGDARSRVPELQLGETSGTVPIMAIRPGVRLTRIDSQFGLAFLSGCKRNLMDVPVIPFST
jgi:hypothetical protein